MADADVIVIPTKTTSRDIEPLWRMRTVAKSSGKPVLYVLNGWNRWRASGDFLRWFRRSCGDDDLVYTLPQSEQYVQAAAAGVSVVEYAKRGGAVRATLELCNAVRGLVGFDPED